MQPGRRKTTYSFFLALAAAFILWFFPSSVGAQARHALAIGSFVLILWVTRPIPHAITGVIGCYLFWSLAAVPFSTAFGGFSQTSAWFVFAAGFFGLMAAKTRIAPRLAARLMGGSGVSYPRLVLGFILTSLLLNFLVPSGIARVIILGGIGLGVVASRGWTKDDLPAKGLFVILTASSALFDKLMITGGTTMLAQGIIEKVGKVAVFWSQWFFALLPALLLTILACWAIVLWLFPARSLQRPSLQRPVPEERAPSKTWSPAERRCAFFFLAAILLWVTDFAHHIPPAMVALGIAFAASLPRIGVLDMEDLKKLDFFPFLFTASALSLGETFLKTGALDVLTQGLRSVWQPLAHNFFSSAIGLYWTSFGYHLLVPSDPATLSTSLPVVVNFALVHHWPPFAAGLVWTLGLSGKLFIYQSGVLIAGHSFGFFGARDFLKVGLTIAVVEFLLLLFLVAWYWPLIGVIP